MSFLKSKRFIASVSTVSFVLSAITVLALPAQSASETKSITLSGFSANSTKLSTGMKSKLASFVNKNKSYGFVTCVGFADKPGSATANSFLGKKRASSACQEVVRVNQSLEVSGTRGKWDSSRSGSDVRRVKITLSKSSTATLTTSFKYRGGSKALVSIKSGIGETITLPLTTKEGYQFVGWFTKRKGGVQVGIGQGFYSPTKSRTLFARWIPGSEPVLSEAASCTVTSKVIMDWQEALVGQQFELQTIDIPDTPPVGLNSVGFVTLPALDDDTPLGLFLGFSLLLSGIPGGLGGFEQGDVYDENIELLPLIASCFDFNVTRNGSLVYAISGEDFANGLSYAALTSPEDLDLNQESYSRFAQALFLGAKDFSGAVGDEYQLNILWGSSSIQLDATYVGAESSEVTVTVVTQNMIAGDFVYVCVGMPIWEPAQANTSCISSTPGVQTISTNGTYDYTWTITSFETDGRIYTYPVRDGVLMNTLDGIDATPSLVCDNLNAYFTGCYVDESLADLFPPTITYTFPVGVVLP